MPRDAASGSGSGSPADGAKQTTRGDGAQASQTKPGAKQSVPTAGTVGLSPTSTLQIQAALRQSLQAARSGKSATPALTPKPPSPGASSQTSGRSLFRDS